MPLQGAPGILAAADHRRRAGDARQVARRVGPLDQGALLAFELLWGGAADHRTQGVHQRPIVQPAGVQHGRQPGVGDHLHALGPGAADELEPRPGLAFLQAMGAGIDQGQALHAGPAETPDLQRHPPAHGVAGDPDRAGRRFQNPPGHGFERLQAQEVGREHRPVASEHSALGLPYRSVAQQARQQAEGRRFGHGRHRGGDRRMVGKWSGTDSYAPG